MSEYVKENNKHRKVAETELEKSFWKLMNNSCYGQLLMNEAKFINGIFVSGGGEPRKKAISNWRTLHYNDISENLCFIAKVSNRGISKPVICGISVLGISHAFMMDMWYSIKEYLNNKGITIYVLFTDTDSVGFSVYAPNESLADIFKFIRHDPDFAYYFDLNDIKMTPDGTRIPFGTKEDPAPIDNPYFCRKINKKVFGKFKFAEKNLLEWSGCKTKMYSDLKQKEIDRDGERALDKMLLFFNDSLLVTSTKAKGVPSSCIDDDDKKRGNNQMKLEGNCIDKRHHDEMVNHSVMVNSAKNGKEGPLVKYNHFIKSTKYDIATGFCQKVSINACNDKVETLTNDFHSRSLGHYLNGKMIKKKELIKIMCKKDY